MPERQPAPHAGSGDPYAARVPAPGSSIGPWRVVREIGRGSTSIVFAVTGPKREAPEYALKLPLPGTLADAAASARFLRGARVQQRLGHPAVLRIVDIGTDAHHGPYLVTELVRGATLAEALRTGDLPARRALEVLTAVASALDAAAAAGAVHRDVKPSNILLGERGAVLADFGLARDHEDDPTLTGALSGTLAYLAPELARGGEPSAASDRYALACVAYQCLTGEPVYPRATDAAVLYAHIDEPPPAASARRAALPGAIDGVLATGLAKDPAARPASATAFVDALEQALGAAAQTLPSPSPQSHAASDETLAPAEPAAPQPSAASRTSRRRRAVAAGLAVLVAGLGAVALLAGPGGGDDLLTGPPPPPVAAGRVALGSDLRGEDIITGRDCDGAERSGTSRACSIAQLALPGRTISIPEDGLIRAFTVRGMTGPVALQVLRTTDGRTFQLSRSDTFEVPDPGAHRFEVELDAGAGDRLALAITPRTTLGLRATAGARTERWNGAVSEGSPVGERTGLDRELLLRGELDPGAVRDAPEQITGTQAARAPAGREVAASSTRLPDGREVRVALVLVDGRVVIDLTRAGRRRARLVLDGLDPAGRPVEFKAFESPGNDSQLNVGWLPPGGGKPEERYFGLGAESLEAYS